MECLFCCHTGTGTADNTLQLIRVHNAVILTGGGGEGGILKLWKPCVELVGVQFIQSSAG